MGKYTIPNLRNACRVLNFLCHHDEGLSLPDISRALDIPRTTTLRILSTLCEETFAVKRDDGRYQLGRGLIPLGLRKMSTLNVREVGAPVLKDLAHDTGATAHLAILSEGQSLLLDVCNSPFPMNATSPPGTTASLNCSSTGKVFLAFILKDEIADWLRETGPEDRTPKSMTTLAELEAEADKVLSQGYALDDEEYFHGIRCLSAPVFDAHGDVAASIGVMTTKDRLPKNKVKVFARQVMDAAARVSHDLGSH